MSASSVIPIPSCLPLHRGASGEETQMEGSKDQPQTRHTSGSKTPSLLIQSAFSPPSARSKAPPAALLPPRCPGDASCKADGRGLSAST
ncbi:hypothetical protein CDD80_7486 [Ophiocordyceps camponoti-rufipedis]|uniref:Uncharacterized protein n=1 Tax=Ophiocordyceps camponoti-rufipedis TaxID=2004952 RepID=A0A2C5YMF4_9HYPO|nr:hypothetical protein CDD80_7486 [Ophiocordyceps camponoti-rufipedis]